MGEMSSQYNTKNPGVKRLMREAIELSEATEEYSAKPLDDNLFEWHFTIRGPVGTEFEGGIYHGRIILPKEYPMQPPHIILLTPNGRFEINKKICLSISGHHPETWQPSWSIRTALLALIAFMPTPSEGTIGSIDYTPAERKVLAKKSQVWVCTTCGEIASLLSKTAAIPPSPEELNVLDQIALKAEEEQLSRPEMIEELVEPPSPLPEVTAVENRPNSLRSFKIEDILMAAIAFLVFIFFFRRWGHGEHEMYHVNIPE